MKKTIFRDGVVKCRGCQDVTPGPSVWGAVLCLLDTEAGGLFSTVGGSHSAVGKCGGEHRCTPC